jgi:hypothetical protein
MTLNAAFDESGKYNDCKLVIFGSLMNREWSTRLRRAGIPLPQGRKGPFLHMVELNRLHMRAGGNRAAQRKIEALANSLANCICEFALEGCWNYITVNRFNSLPESERGRYKDPFYYAFEAGVLALANSTCLGPDDEIALICDDSDEARKCLESFRKLKNREPSVKNKIPVVAFGDDEVYPPLQAADMFAYCARAAGSSASGSGLWNEPLRIMLSKFSDLDHEPITVNTDQHES